MNGLRLLLLGLLLGYKPVLEADVEQGRRIYMEGVDRNGQVIASSVNGLPSPAVLACVNCHRESGLGTSESGTTVPPVAWKLLQQGGLLSRDDGRFLQLRPGQDRYDRESLHRLLTSGITPSGRRLSETMPRYALTRSQSDDLVDFLDRLFPKPEGVDEEFIDLAVVIDPSIDPGLRAQHKAFLQGLIRMKNSGTRSELKRKRYSPIQKQPQYQAYRKWRLHFWELDGTAEGWADQLRRRYDRQPVFAFLAPLVGDRYPRLAEFCDQEKIPCLFPPLASATRTGYYSFVFDDRERREREFLRRLRRGESNALRYVDDQGQAQRLGPDSLPRPLDDVAWQRFIDLYPELCGQSGELLLAIDEPDLDRLDELDCADRPHLSLLLLPQRDLRYDELSKLLQRARASPLCVATNYAEPRRIPGRALRASTLSRRFGISDIDAEMLVKDLFAFGLLSDALYQLNGAFSRDYLLEIIEHMLNSYPNYTFYRETSGAPYQRYIAGPLRRQCRGGNAT